MAIAKKNSPVDMGINDSPEWRSIEDNLPPDWLDSLSGSTNAVNNAPVVFAPNDRAEGKETNMSVNISAHINLTYTEDGSQPDCPESPSSSASTVNNMLDLSKTTCDTTVKDHIKPYRILDPDESCKLMATEDIPQPDRFDPQPNLVASANTALDLLDNSHGNVPGENNTQGNDMDIDDVEDNDPDGGVSLVPLPPSPPSRGSTANLGLGLTITTNLLSTVPHSRPLTPKPSPSPLPTIYEEADAPALSSEMDFSFDDDDGMPPLEDTTPSMPGMWPIFNMEKPFQTRYNPTSPSPLKNSVEAEIENPPDLPPRTSSLPGAPELKACNSEEIDHAYSDDESPTKDEEIKEEKEESVRVEWSNQVWPPDNLFERAFCERVCQEVARANGFQRVYIRSRVITEQTEYTYSTQRTIFVEPHIIATFVSIPPAPAEPIEPKKPTWTSIYTGSRRIHLRSHEAAQKARVVKKTAEVHVGPDYALPRETLGEQEKMEMWEKWGLWRKAGKEIVEWCWDEDLRPYYPPP